MLLLIKKNNILPKIIYLEWLTFALCPYGVCLPIQSLYRAASVLKGEKKCGIFNLLWKLREGGNILTIKINNILPGEIFWEKKIVPISYIYRKQKEQLIKLLIVQTIVSSDHGWTQLGKSDQRKNSYQFILLRDTNRNGKDLKTKTGINDKIIQDVYQ